MIPHCVLANYTHYFTDQAVGPHGAESVRRELGRAVMALKVRQLLFSK